MLFTAVCQSNVSTVALVSMRGKPSIQCVELLLLNWLNFEMCSSRRFACHFLPCTTFIFAHFLDESRHTASKIYVSYELKSIALAKIKFSDHWLVSIFALLKSFSTIKEGSGWVHIGSNSVCLFNLLTSTKRYFHPLTRYFGNSNIKKCIRFTFVRVTWLWKSWNWEKATTFWMEKACARYYW